MKNRISIFTFILILIFGAQSEAQQWIKYFGGSSEDKAYAITVDKDGFIYLGGYTTTTNQGTNFMTEKINPGNGSQVWVKYYNGPASQDDKVYAITVDKLNNVYSAGFTTALGNGTDMTVVKYNSSGTQLWASSYNSTTNGDDGAYAVAVDDSLNVYLTGYVTVAGYDMYLIKFNSAGTAQWGRFKGGTANQDDKAYAIKVDELNNVYIGGYTTNTGTGADFTLIKYNRYNGEPQWVANMMVLLIQMTLQYVWHFQIQITYIFQVPVRAIHQQIQKIS